jgi:hypothetical protein
VSTIQNTGNTKFYITFVDSNNIVAGPESLYTNTGISFNPSTDILELITGYQSGDGTVSAPPYSFIADTNSGLYRVGTDHVGLSTNGSHRFSANSVGLVNIGGNGNGSLNYQLEGNVSTSTNTVTTLLSLSTITDYFYTVEAWVIAGNISSPGAVGGKVYAVFRNVGGVLTQVGSTETTFVREDFPIGTPSFTIDGSGTTIRLRVTGLSGVNIDWYGKFVYQYLNAAV